MKKLLVPIDFSTYAVLALNYAVELAARSEGEVILLHVRNQRDTKPANLTNANNDNDEAQRINDFADDVRKRGISVTTVLKDGDITDNIISAAGENKVDAIVMGTMGATGFRTAIFGTKAANVIQRSTVPVITIPFDYQWKSPENILLAINEAEEDAKLLAPVLKLATLFDAKVKTVVFSTEKALAADIIESDRVIYKMEHLLSEQYANRSIETVHLSGKDFHQTLQEYIDANHIDLLVMITHKRSFIQSLFKFSMTREMAYHTTVPLLSLHSMHV